MELLCFCSVLRLLCLCACLFICALWSPAGKGLTSWLSFVVSNCEFVTFPLVSWVRSGTWLYRFLIFAPLLTVRVNMLSSITGGPRGPGLITWIPAQFELVVKEMLFLFLALVAILFYRAELLVEGIMRDISVKWFWFWISGSGDVV